MTMLKLMGIQAWRKRRSAAEIQNNPHPKTRPAPVMLNVLGKQSSASVSLEPSLMSVDRRIWPDKPLAAQENPAKLPLEKQPLDGPLSHRASASATSVPGDKSRTHPARPVMPKPMPAPKPAPDLGAAPAIEPIVGLLPIAPSANPPFGDDQELISGGESPAQNANALDTSTWTDLRNMINSWRLCSSCGEGKSLLGHGDVNADWLFVGEAPLSADLTQKKLFSGRSGKLFESMLAALNLQRESVYTTTLFKCLATDDITEIPVCDVVLKRQIQLIQPKVIVVFGELAATILLKANADLETLRANDQCCLNSDVVVVPTYTLAQMLDDASLKSHVWNDLKKAVQSVNLQA